MSKWMLWSWTILPLLSALSAIQCCFQKHGNFFHFSTYTCSVTPSATHTGLKSCWCTRPLTSFSIVCKWNLFTFTGTMQKLWWSLMKISRCFCSFSMRRFCYGISVNSLTCSLLCCLIQKSPEKSKVLLCWFFQQPGTAMMNFTSLCSALLFLVIIFVSSIKQKCINRLPVLLNYLSIVLSSCWKVTLQRVKTVWQL